MADDANQLSRELHALFEAMPDDADKLFMVLHVLIEKYQRLPRLRNPGQILFEPRPATLCKSFGLSDDVIRQCLSNRWLSFDPREVENLTQGQRAEIECVGHALKCGEQAARRLLSQLDPPFHYDLEGIFIDVTQLRWRSVETTARILVGLHAPFFAGVGADIGEHRYPQDGVFSVTGGDCWERAFCRADADYRRFIEEGPASG